MLLMLLTLGSTVVALVSLPSLIHSRSSTSFGVLAVSAVVSGSCFGAWIAKAGPLERFLLVVLAIVTLVLAAALGIVTSLESRGGAGSTKPVQVVAKVLSPPPPEPMTPKPTPLLPLGVMSLDDSMAYERISFEDLAGCEEAVDQLKRLFRQAREPELFREFGAEPVRGILLYGPPGTGKTALARAAATACGAGFHAANCAAFINRYVGVGASNVRELIDKAYAAHLATRTLQIVFLDEIDSIGATRTTSLDSSGGREHDRTINQLLSEMDGFASKRGLVFVATTNRLDVLDPALLRAGRFDRKIKLDLPDIDAREKIFAIHTRDKPLAPGVSLRYLAEITDGVSGADIKAVCNNAASAAADRWASGPKMIRQDDLCIAFIELAEEKGFYHGR